MNVLITFTYGVTLEQWYNSGIIFRELELYKRLTQKNVNFNLLTYGDHKDLNYPEVLGTIKVFPVGKYLTSKFSKFQSLLLPLRLNQLFKGIDIIKTNQMEGSLIACVGKLLYGKKLIIRCGYEWLRTYLSDYETKKKKNYFKFLFRYTWMYLIEFISYKLADGIILTNERDIQFIIQKFRLKKKKKKIRIFYNFVDVELFKPLKLKKKDKSVLYIGRLTHEKNLFNLINAFRDLDGFTLDIIGKGPLEDKLKQTTKELDIKINFLGRFPNNKLPEIINQYQIFILPSYYEGNPKVLLEAMSCGIPCIGTNVIGINDILNHKKNGYLCDHSSNSIKNAINFLYENRDLGEKIGQNGRNFIMKNCSLDLIANKEFLFYKEILEDKK